MWGLGLCQTWEGCLCGGAGHVGRGHVMPQNLPSPTPSYDNKETEASVEPSGKNDSGLKGRCVCMWRGTSIFQALSQKRGEMETSRYFSLASGRRSKGTGQPGVSPDGFHHTGVSAGQSGLRGPQCLDGSCGHPRWVCLEKQQRRGQQPHSCWAFTEPFWYPSGSSASRR